MLRQIARCHGRHTFRTRGAAHTIVFVMAIHSFLTLRPFFHASPILAVMLSWIGTRCTTLIKLLINYHQGCRLRWALCQSIKPYGQVAQPGTRTYATNTNVRTSMLTGPLGHRDTLAIAIHHYLSLVNTSHQDD